MWEGGAESTGSGDRGSSAERLQKVMTITGCRERSSPVGTLYTPDGQARLRTAPAASRALSHHLGQLERKRGVRPSLAPGTPGVEGRWICHRWDTRPDRGRHPTQQMPLVTDRVISKAVRRDLAGEGVSTV